MRSVVIAAAATVVQLLAHEASSAPQGSTPHTPFLVGSELQAMYDEISEAELQFANDHEVDLFHSVVTTPDWTFVDASGQHHSWPDVRSQEIAFGGEPRFAAVEQAIDKLTLVPGGAVASVTMKTTRTIADAEGHYGPKGATHTLTTRTKFRDTWITPSDPLTESWLMKIREQIGQPKVVVDEAESYNARSRW